MSRFIRQKELNTRISDMVLDFQRKPGSRWRKMILIIMVGFGLVYLLSHLVSGIQFIIGAFIAILLWASMAGIS